MQASMELSLAERDEGACIGPNGKLNVLTYQKIILLNHGCTPYMCVYWANPVVHRVLIKYTIFLTVPTQHLFTLVYSYYRPTNLT